MYGCTTTTTTVSPAEAPTGTTTVEVGSGGSVTAETGSSSGSLTITLVDQDQVVISGEAYLTTANITIEIWATSVATVEGGISTVTAPVAGSALPISLVMSLDESGSMSTDDALASLEVAAKSFVDNMGATDELGIVVFSSYTNVTVEAPVMTTTAANKTILKATIEAMSATGSTALYDSLGLSVDTVVGGTNTRKAVIGMTDGKENDSDVYTTSTAVINHANASSIPIYMVGLGSVTASTMQSLADGTGGLYYYAPTSSDLDALYTKISQALTNTWTVAFTSSSITFTSGITYTVKVTVSYTLSDGSIISDYALFTLTI